jgi:FRG domain
MAWEEREVVNLEQFVRELTDILPTTAAHDVAFWFRGQSNAAWHLESSFMRSSRHLGIEAEAIVRLEAEALKAFRSQAHLFVEPHLLDKVKTIPCWWALMQHHRAPTRLLDWTASPYVAAYFAAQPNDTDAPGVVWCFCSHRLRDTFESEYGTIPDFESPEAPTWFERKLEEMRDARIVIPLSFGFASSERMVAQQGRFTMCFKLHQRQNCIIDQIGPQYTRKLIIPHERKHELLLRLREMNITGAALFPGVDGLGRWISELVSLGELDKMVV